ATLPAGPASGLAVLISDGPRGAAEAAAAAPLAAAGAAAITVDGPGLVATLNAADRDCAYLVSDIERLGREVVRATGGTAFHAPILAGAGLGGALVLDILTQTPPATIDAVIAVDPAAGTALRAPLCTQARRRDGPEGVRYDLAPGPPRAALSVGLTDAAPASARARVAALTAGGVVFAPLALVPGAPADAALVEALAAAAAARALEGDAKARVEHPAAPTRGTFAIVISGDGGWRDIDRKLAQAMQADGVPVLGLDALRWFWSERTPAETARELARLIDHYSVRWGAPSVALIGYSFGAGVLPEAYLALPPEHQARVALISLLGLADTADWEITVSGWLGRSSFAARPVAPFLFRLPLERVQCVMGEDESESICPVLIGGPAEVVAMPGGHHFDGDYEALARHVLSALDGRLAARSREPPVAETTAAGSPAAAAGAEAPVAAVSSGPTPSERRS
ncbi:MAG: AcvB/VirJ family lysyl-phosphatidylglycerol hydrolase, partial [Pseudomonadota bacterium]|nr:AcvB/VirJ family lysyl-phosphatidylglycerol hydrolase [Pseudomonadota bacterium]